MKICDVCAKLGRIERMDTIVKTDSLSDVDLCKPHADEYRERIAAVQKFLLTTDLSKSPLDMAVRSLTKVLEGTGAPIMNVKACWKCGGSVDSFGQCAACRLSNSKG